MGYNIGFSPTDLMGRNVWAEEFNQLPEVKQFTELKKKYKESGAPGFHPAEANPLYSNLFGQGGMGGMGGYTEMSTQNPLQQKIMEMFGGGLQGGLPQAFTHLQDLLSNNPEAMAKFEAPYRTQFEQQTVPALAERFAGIGAGAQSSSAFQQALGQAGSNLQESLASLRGGLQTGAANSLLGGAQNLLDINTKAFLPNSGGGDEGFWKSALQGAAPGLGEGTAQALMGLIKKYGPAVLAFLFA